MDPLLSKHPDLVESYQALIKEAERRNKAQVVIKEVWIKKFEQLFGKSAPSTEPLLKPCKDESVYCTLQQYFDINLNALNEDNIKGYLVQEAVRAHHVAISILEKHDCRTEELDKLLAQITSRATLNALIHESISIMEDVLGEAIDPKTKKSYIKICTAVPEAAKDVHIIACYCRSIKSGDESAKNMRDELLYPTILCYFIKDKEVEEMLKKLKVKSEEKPSKPSWIFG